MTVVNNPLPLPTDQISAEILVTREGKWRSRSDGWPSPSGGWPAGVWQVPYDARGLPGVEYPWLAGSNCQRYAYEILQLFGRSCPPLRSAELWRDTTTVDHPEPLDLAFFNATSDPYGAHLGVWMGHDTVLHLCREVARPAAWSLADFAHRDRYAVLLGFKHVG